MKETIDIINLRRAVLTSFTQAVSPDNLISIRQILHHRDPQNTGVLSYDEF